MSDIELNIDRWERLVAHMPFDPANPQLQEGPLLEALTQQHALLAPRARPSRLVIAVTSQTVSSEVNAAAQRAIALYCHHQAEICRLNVRATRRTGWLSLAVAVVLLAVSLGAAAAIDHLEPLPDLVNQWLREGLVILGWVVLWRPLDNLLYEWWRPYRMAKTYEMFARLPLVLIAAK